jgi:cell division protein FtsL
MIRLILNFSFVLLLIGCSNKHNERIMSLESKIDSLNKEIADLKLEMNDDKQLINDLIDEVRFKESEISFWGHKLDSCKNKK